MAIIALGEDTIHDLAEAIAAAGGGGGGGGDASAANQTVGNAALAAIQSAAEAILAAAANIDSASSSTLAAVSAQTPVLAESRDTLNEMNEATEPAGAVGLGTKKTVTFTSATGALTAGQIIATTQEVTEFFRDVGKAAYIKNYSVIDLADQKAIVDLVFLRSNTSLGTEGSTPDIDDTEALELLCVGGANNPLRVIATDYTDLGGVSVATKDAGMWRITGADDQTSVWIAAITGGTPTYGAAGALIVIFELAWD